MKRVFVQAPFSSYWLGTSDQADREPGFMDLPEVMSSKHALRVVADVAADGGDEERDLL